MFCRICVSFWGGNYIGSSLNGLFLESCNARCASLQDGAEIAEIWLPGTDSNRRPGD